jgi:hypothetical protein
MFPWLGTRSFRTLRRYLGRFADEYKISKIEFEGCYYLMFRMERGDGMSLIQKMGCRIREEGISLDSLIGLNECPVYEKYDGFIPSELLRIAFREDKLRADEILTRFEIW